MIKRYALFSLLMLLFTRLGAQNYVLQGTIGKYPVVMKLTCSNKACDATYFYESSKQDILLEGVKQGNKILLYNIYGGAEYGNKDTTEQLALNLATENSFKGVWKNKKKTLEVDLVPLDVKSINQPNKDISAVSDLLKNDAYEYKRISLMNINEDSTVQKGNYKVAFLHVDKTSVYGVKIINAANGGVIKKVNDRLIDLLINKSSAFYACAISRGTGDFDFSVSNTYFSDNVISLLFNESYDCGGAHPDGGEVSINFNAATGEELALEDVLHLVNQNAPPEHSETKTNDAWIKYRDEVYSPALVEFLKKQFPKYMIEGNNCNYSDKDVWTFPNWYFTNKGLVIHPVFPHINNECGDTEWSVILYDKVRKYLDPTKKLKVP